MGDNIEYMTTCTKLEITSSHEYMFMVSLVSYCVLMLITFSLNTYLHRNRFKIAVFAKPKNRPKILIIIDNLINFLTYANVILSVGLIFLMTKIK